MKEIAIVLGLGFLFTGAWKWGESKWIRIFQVLQLYKQKVDSTFSKEEAEMYNYQYQEAVMARKSRHKMTGFMIALFAVFSYSFLGLTWAAFWCFLINWTLFWIGDMLLNIFIKQKALYRGTTAIMDRIPFWVRFVLILVFIAGLVFLSDAQSLKTPLVIQFNNESTSVTQTARVNVVGNYNIIVCAKPDSAVVSDSLFNVYIDFNFWWVEKTFSKEDKYKLMEDWNIILTAEEKEIEKKTWAYFRLNNLIKEGIKKTLDFNGVTKRYIRITN